MSRTRIVAVFVASYVIVWVGAVLTSLGFALAIDTEGQDTGDLGPLLSEFFIGVVVLNFAWIFVAVIGALVVWLPLGVALGVAPPTATASWSSDPYR